jgi:hypothetical protein
VVGLGLAFIWAPIQRELSLWSPGNILWRALGVFNVSWAAGGIVGTLALPEIRRRWGMGAAMSALVAVIAATWAFLRQRPAARSPDASLAALETVPAATARLFVRLGWLANFAQAVSVGALHYMLADVARRFGWSPLWAMSILAAKEGGRFLAFLLLRFVPGWHYSLRWLLGVQALGGAALVACGFTDSPGAYLAFFAIAGAFSGLAYYSSIYDGLNLREGEGQKSSLHEGILSLGLSIGPIACGVVGGLWPDEPGALVAFVGCIVLLCGLFELGLWARSRGGRSSA